MRKKVTYVALDGKEFDTENECREHEESRKDLINLYRAIDTIQNYCKNSGCHTCPFFNGDCIFTEDTPNNWEV